MTFENVTSSPTLHSSHTLAGIRRFLISELTKNKIENSVGEADLILTRLLSCSRSVVLGHPEKILTDCEIASAQEILRRRMCGEPLQYILEEAFFYGRPFEVQKGVLIPRPETELLVEMALDLLSDTPSPAERTFLDWGTGSGCIAITLLLEHPSMRAVMAEKNPLSLLQAWKNTVRYGLFHRCFLWHSQNPKDIPIARQSLDLIVSNPPYIPTRELPSLMREVRDYEPQLALDGGEDGMDFYRLLFKHASSWLRPGGLLLFEIGSEVQFAEMKGMPSSTCSFVKSVTDLEGHLRCAAWKY